MLQWELRKLGEDASEVLEYSPASFFVIRHVRLKMSCRKCSCVVQAPAPERVIERGIPGAGLLAHVVTAKLCDHQFLYRQAQIFAREGVDLDRSIPAVWFTYSPNRKGEHPQRNLAKFKGILQAGVEADAFAGFDKLYEGGKIQEATCMAHIRRKFFDLVKAHYSPIAAEAVHCIAALYLIEKEIEGRSADERRAVRTARAKPLFDDMRRWLEQALTQLAPKSETAAAIHYALALWDALARYLDDGRIEIDNLIAERASRPVAIGR